MSAHGVELPAWECLELLRSRPVGRICVVDHGYPIAIPVNYEVVGTNNSLQVVVRTAPETILGRYEGLGSLEVDDIALDTGTAWSVIVRGTLHRVLGAHELADPHPLIDSDRQRWVTLQMSAITGRRFTVRQDEESGTVDWQESERSSE